MRDESIPVDVLDRLAEMLRSTHLPVQATIAMAVEADQPFVSRVMRGGVKRVTPRVERLWKYVSSRVSEPERALEAVADIVREVASSPAIGAGRRSGGRRRHEPLPSSDAYAADALDGVNAYLADGYDPRLIVEQLVVLRRAQQVRRAGRTTGEAD